ncbi:MAG TPA: hypothetical protein PLZ26_06800 [Bacteroidia bacterium]|nr:hypothetical protein [Bacteroidia bacterium]
MQATLNASNFNGYNISCYGMQDGTLTVNASSGTAPYSYTWSNGDTLATVDSLAAGYYSVRVRDAAGGDTTLQITLTQPEQLAITEMTPYYYANDYNVSTYGACNGSVTTQISGGVLPLTYHWEPGQQNILAPSNLCGRENTLTVTDLNGCKASSSINLKEPQRDDWTMSGNWGSNPTDNFIGTNDSIDLVFKTNGNERLRIAANGTTNFKNNINLEQSLLFKNNAKIAFRPATTGIPDILSFGADPDVNLLSVNPNCNPTLNTPLINQFKGTIQLYDFITNNNNPFSTLSILEMGFDGFNSIIEAQGNNSASNSNRLLINYYCGKDVFVGKANSGDLTANNNLLVNGKMGIGISQQDLNVISNYKLIVEGAVGVREMRIVNPAQSWPDYVFADNYKLKSLSDVEQFVESNKHLPGFAPAAIVASEGQNIGQLQVLQQQTIEEMYLHIIALEKRISKLEQENKKLKSQRP